MDKRDKISTYGTRSLLRNPLLGKPVAYLLIFTFLVSNTSYGFEPASTMRQVRPEEVVEYREAVEALIENYQDHEVRIDGPLKTAADEPGTPRLRYIQLSDFRYGTALGTICNYLRHSGLENLTESLFTLCKQKRLQRFRPHNYEWKVYDTAAKKLRRIDGHASDRQITIRDGLSDIEDAAVLAHELLDWFLAVRIDESRGQIDIEYLGPILEVAVKEALTTGNIRPVRDFANAYADTLANLSFERRHNTQPGLLKAASATEATGARTRHYTSARTATVNEEDEDTAQIGVTLQDAANASAVYLTGEFNLANLGITRILSDEITGEESLKLVVNRNNRRVAGAEIKGPHAQDIKHIIDTAINLGTTIDDLAEIIFAHPTAPEAIGETAELLTRGKSIHTPPPREERRERRAERENPYDVAIIGAGPAGYVAALRAAQEGKKVALIDKGLNRLGGTCLKEGCIPTKIAWRAINSQSQLNTKRILGDIAWRTKKTVVGLQQGIDYLLKTNRVELIPASAVIENIENIDTLDKMIKIPLEGSTPDFDTVIAEKVIFATGSRPSTIPGIEIDNNTVIDSTKALELLRTGKIPRNLTVVGAGAIGLEFATIFRALGCNVTVVEKERQICPGILDEDIAAVAQAKLEAKGITFMLGQGFSHTDIPEDGSSKVLMAVGRIPNTEGFREAGINLSQNGTVFQNNNYQLSTTGPGYNERVYGAGDILDTPQLAHTASFEARIAGKVAANPHFYPETMNDAPITPSVIFTDPEIASVGMTEAEARKLYAPRRASAVQVHYFRTEDGNNLMRFVIRAHNHAIVGASIIGPKAPYLVAEIGLAIKMEKSLEELMPDADSLYSAESVRSAQDFGPGALYPDDTTPLIGEHEKYNADTEEFGGKQGMPMQYAPANDPDRTIADEVMAVHNAAGLFDITHMRALKVEGEDAFNFLQYTTTADIHELKEIGNSQYSFIADEDGSLIDDIWVYRIELDSYMLFVNASNWEKDLAHLAKHRSAPSRQNKDITIKDLGSDPHEQKVAIALQGKMSDRVLQPIADYDLESIGRSKIVECDLIVEGQRVRALVSRTGYTGEYGFEIFIHPDHVAALWRNLLVIGEPLGAIPCGLSARNVLRIEAGCPLYGHEIPHATPYEIGQGKAVALHKKNKTGEEEVNFIGKDRLIVQKENAQLQLVTIVFDKNRPDEHSLVSIDGRVVGHIKSAVRSPLLDKPVALALVNKENAEPGQTVKVGDRQHTGKIVRTPIYRYKQYAPYLIVNRPTGGTDIDDREAMLRDIGGDDFTEIELFKLFEEKVYPSYLKACEMQGLPAKPFDEFFRDNYTMPDGVPSHEGLSWRGIVDKIFDWFKELSEKNKDLNKCPSFLGNDIRNWNIPDIVNRIGQHRGFSTGYTAYQPEASQGNLAALYTYQSLISALTGMESSNASLYNGPTALAESMLMAHRIVNPEKHREDWKRNKVVVANSLSPACREVMQNYANDMGLEIIEVPFDNTTIKANTAAVRKTVVKAGDELVCVIAEQPNFLGAVETELKAIGDTAHDKKGLFLVHVNDPHTLASLRPPAEYGADIVTAEGQPFGTPMALGGLGLGIMATRKEYMDEMPGRIVGKTVDITGKEAFTLIKGSREQHNAREHATSNICTAQALIAIRATAYLLSMGWNGLIKADLHSRKLCTRFIAQIQAIPGFSALSTDVLGQVAIRVPTGAAKLNEVLLDKHDIISGIDVSEYVSKNGGPAKQVVLFSFTNANTEEDVDRLVEAIIAVMEGYAKYYDKPSRDLDQRHWMKTVEDIGRIRKDWRSSMAKDIDQSAKRMVIPGIPSLSDEELYKLFWKWANLNHDMDKDDYFLGSCTMKENDRENERVGNLPGFMNLHPLQPVKTLQGILQLLYKFKVYLCSITGMFASTLLPLAGAHGELVALKMFRAYHRYVHRGQPRDLIITPQTSHGTNPASITEAGMKAIVVATDADGNVNINDPVELDKHGKITARNLMDILNDPELKGRIAGIMLTIPNTLGLFEPRTPEISAMVHAEGGLVYMDGANFNAIIGQVRPADLGVDAMHFNPHKTFDTLHGGGGPGAGPLVVSALLQQYLPSPTIEYRAGQTTGGELATAAGYYIDYSGPGRSIGNVSGYLGPVGVLIRAARYAFNMGTKGLRKISINATVNANHIFAKTIASGFFKVEHNPNDPRMHECVVTPCDEILERGITTMDIAKRLLDKGVHPPTVYFPKNVHEPLMIEPTDTASKRDVEVFEKALIEVAKETLGDEEAIRKAVKELVEQGHREELEYELTAADFAAKAHRESDESAEEALVHTIAESKKITLEEALETEQGRRDLGILILYGAPWSTPVRRIDDDVSDDTGTSDIGGFLEAVLSEEETQAAKAVEAPPKLRERYPDGDNCNYYFSESHEYIRVEEVDGKKIATIGITLNATVLNKNKHVEKLPGLGDIAVGRVVAKNDAFVELLETSKVISDLCCPVSGTVLAVHYDIAKPSLVSKDPYGDRTETREQGGWLIKIELSDESELDGLMRLPAYIDHVRKIGGVQFASKINDNEDFDTPASSGGGRTATTVAGLQADLDESMQILRENTGYADDTAEDIRADSIVQITAPGKSLVICAEPALINGLVLDLEYTLSAVNDNALSEIVVYAKDAGNARVITGLIDASNDKHNKKFKPVILLESELLAIGKPISTPSNLLRSITEYIYSKPGFSATKQEDIFGIMMGPLERDRLGVGTGSVAKWARAEKIKVLALRAIGDAEIYGYSFNDALNALANISDDAARYLIFLDPIKRLTPELQQEYEDYRRSFEALAAV